MKKYELKIINNILEKHKRNDLKLIGMAYDKPSHSKTLAFEYCIDKMHDIQKETNMNIVDFGIISYNTYMFTFGAILYEPNTNTYTILYESPRNSHRFDNLGFNKGELL